MRWNLTLRNSLDSSKKASAKQQETLVIKTPISNKMRDKPFFTVTIEKGKRDLEFIRS